MKIQIIFTLFLVLLTACSQNDTCNVEKYKILKELTISVKENIDVGFNIGTVERIEDDSSVIMYIALEGEGHEDFRVDRNGKIILKTNVLNYKKQNIYNLIASAKTNSGLSQGVNLTINIIDCIDKPKEIANILANDASDKAAFGHSVSMSGNYIVVGAPGDDSHGRHTGSAYIYKVNENKEIKQIAKIQASNPHKDYWFGKVVSISGKYIIVSESYSGKFRGSVYVYKVNENDTVKELTTIQPDDIDDYTFFGHSLAMDKNYFIVSGAESVYLFKIDSDDNIKQLAKLKADDIETGDEFGISVSIYDDYILIGAPKEDTRAEDSGSVYLFKKHSDTDIEQIAKIQADDLHAFHGFGYKVLINQNYIAVTSRYVDLKDIFKKDPGSIYILKINSDEDIKQIAKIEPKKEEQYFGTILSLNGSSLATAVQNKRTGPVRQVNLYQIDLNDKLIEIGEIHPKTNNGFEYFGNSIVMNKKIIIIGSSRYGDYKLSNNRGTGSMYIFEKKQ